MEVKKIFSVLLALPAFMCGNESYATGIGFTSGVADEKWDDNDNSFSPRINFDVTNYGFVIDSSVAKNKLFNYRFSLTKAEDESSTTKYKGYTMTHDFGFGALRNKYVRLWVGPRMNVAVYKKININGLNISGDVVGLAVGPVIGVNIHLPKVATFSVAAGHLRGRYIGDYNGTGGSSIDLDFDVDSTFVNFLVLFRIKDEY